MIGQAHSSRDDVAQAKVALVPVGSFEQYGPHGTFQVDTGRAYGFGELLAARMYHIETALHYAVEFLEDFIADEGEE